jgi:hypothetical protein
MMVNGNHFQFDRKSLFNFLKTIYSFLDLNSSFKHVCGNPPPSGIEICWYPKSTPKVPEFWYLIVGMWPAPESEIFCKNSAMSNHRH